jgi:hypothetical protein
MNEIVDNHMLIDHQQVDLICNHKSGQLTNVWCLVGSQAISGSVEPVRKKMSWDPNPMNGPKLNRMQNAKMYAFFLPAKAIRTT